MPSKPMPTRLLDFLKKKKKINLLTGTLLLITAIISLVPGLTHLIDGMYSLTPSLLTLDDYVSTVMFSFLMMVTSLVPFSAMYLLWEDHSLGWKLSIVTCAVALLLAIISPAYLYAMVSIVLICGVAVTLELLNAREENRKRDSPIVTENLMKFAFRLAIIICISIVAAILVFVVVMGSPFYSSQFFTSMTLNIQNVNRICWGLKPIGQVGGILSFVIGSLVLVTFCECVAVPIGVLAAIYLAEYSSQNRVVSTIRLFIETLAGSPSVVIAMIGFAIFIVTLKWDQCLWAAAITLSFLALPWNIRIAEESMRSVPRSYREASFALGATQWQTARLVTLYAALPGIITGILLGVGVAIGETLVLIYTYGANVYQLPGNWWKIFSLRQPLPSLTGFMYNTPGSMYIMGNIKGVTGANPVFYSYCLALAAGTYLIMIYLALCIGALLLRNYLNKRMKGS
jgi:phosphate transport system permease protein